MKLFKGLLIAGLWMIYPSFLYAFTDQNISIKTTDKTQALSVQLAQDRDDLMQGLMHRKTLKPYDGMLFDFSSECWVSMWMKNTILSLDMLFISEDGHINYIAANTTPNSLEMIASPHSTRYVLELLAGDAEKRGIAVGDTLILEAP